jgi:aspartyl-tRNA(Asn)/glutamyl-tRNA(Gln) amidotransferase subunit C
MSYSTLDMAPQKKKLSHELTEHIARLGHIELSNADKEQFTNQMNSILEHFEKLNELDVENVEPTHHAMDITNVFREDVPLPSLTQEEALENAPKKEKGHIVAPRIV